MDPKSFLSFLLLAFLATPLAADEVQQPPTYEASDLIRFTMNSGWLDTTADPPAALCRPAPTPVHINGSRATWLYQVKQAPSEISSNPQQVIELTYEDPSDLRVSGHTKSTLCRNEDSLTITGLLHFGTHEVSVLYRSRNDPRIVQFEAYLQEGGQITRTLINTRGDSLQDLWNQHTEEVERFLSPILTKLSRRNLLGPGAADVYAAFPSIAPQAPVLTSLKELLPQLNAPDPRQRDRATRQIQSLGRTGVLAALRLNFNDLCPEERVRLERFITLHRQRPLTPSAAARDAMFLLECLEDEDVLVRQAARTALETVSHKSLTFFDPRDNFDNRFAALPAVRKAVFGTAGFDDVDAFSSTAP